MTYSIINTIVVQGDAELSAAHAHGMATGMLCANEQAQSAEWLTELFLHATPVADKDRATLAYLFEETQNLLVSDEFEFDLLLPGDEALLSEQVEALTHWCQGFLLGVGFTHTASEQSREVTEILKDIVEFTKLDTEAEGEEDESDFMEITEYMRSAVLLLRSELNNRGSREKAKGSR
ncbi:MAG: YecA family protein [Methylobacter sp.]|nr:MAG: YecA family protein [Methylobacter sp.]